MNTTRQISAWRDIIALELIYTGNAGNEYPDFTQFVRTIRSNLGIDEHWSDFDRTLTMLAPLFSPGALRTTTFGPQRTLKENLERALELYTEVFKNFIVRIEGEGVILTPIEDVTLRITRGWCDGRHTVIFHFEFDDPKKGTEFKCKMDKSSERTSYDFYFGEVVYEDVLYLKAMVAGLWVFSNGSFDRLDGRASSIADTSDKFQAFVIKPLPGEKLVIYEGSSARDLGLVPPSNAPRHPEKEVFASIESPDDKVRLSLSLKRGEPRERRPARDRVVVFHDSRLPIAPPEKVGDECSGNFSHEDWADDGDRYFDGF